MSKATLTVTLTDHDTLEVVFYGDSTHTRKLMATQGLELLARAATQCVDDDISSGPVSYETEAPLHPVH